MAVFGEGEVSPEPSCALAEADSMVHSAGMGSGSHIEPRGSHRQTDQPPAKFFRLSHLRKLCVCEQVAAVCYRVRSSGIEFLLVQTRGGRWTFPKGGAEPGLTHAQAAALEAFEEAGVHGRMEEAAFAQYVRRKTGGGKRPPAQVIVSAHLCEVSRLDPPQESNRNRTWLSPENAKVRLRADRAPECGAELARVVDRAVTRLQRQRDEVRIAVVPRRIGQVIEIRDAGRSRVRSVGS
jgi:8-oxo-dGTP pyrophosphatase MutT (NUDIX family)